jgi:hypothetical protein
MFFKHRRSRYHRMSVESCYRAMLADMPNHIPERDLAEGLHSSYSGQASELLVIHLDAYFEAERSCHDFILACLRSANLLPSGPSSFHEFYNAEQKSPGKFSANASDLRGQLLSFWKATGQPIKDYRDCLNHFLSLSGSTWQNAVNMKWQRGAWHATLLMPDNPAEKSARRFSYEGNIDAGALCARLNLETEQFLRQLMHQCLRKWDARITPGEYRTSLRNIRIGN